MRSSSFPFPSTHKRTPGSCDKRERIVRARPLTSLAQQHEKLRNFSRLVRIHNSAAFSWTLGYTGLVDEGMQSEKAIIKNIGRLAEKF